MREAYCENHCAVTHIRQRSAMSIAWTAQVYFCANAVPRSRPTAADVFLLRIWSFGKNNCRRFDLEDSVVRFNEAVSMTLT